jgi:hypothetical protein
MISAKTRVQTAVIKLTLSATAFGLQPETSIALIIASFHWGVAQ